jgi:hypothetical protein
LLPFQSLPQYGSAGGDPWKIGVGVSASAVAGLKDEESVKRFKPQF